METLKEILQETAEKFPCHVFTVVKYRTARFPEFFDRPDYSVALLKGRSYVVAYRLCGVKWMCKLEDFAAELARRLRKVPSFEEMKEGVRDVEKKINKMGIEVAYRDLDYEIESKDLLFVQKEVYEKFYMEGNVLQVFRVINGPRFGFVTLLGNQAYIQKPASDAAAMTELGNAMLANCYMSGTQSCPVCCVETRDYHTAFTCVMHVFCKDCIDRILLNPMASCPICRAPPKYFVSD